MPKKKRVTIIGARPQFIKCAPLSNKIRKYFKEILVHTGQHYSKNMSDLFFKELNIPNPDYNLNIGSGSHGKQTGDMIIKIEYVLLKEKPSLVIVYGDTNSTIAGAIASVKLNIPVVHIEAGLRSFNKEMPEEHNRIVTDHLSELLFVPSKIGMKHLKREGLSKKAYFVGDIMYDALLYNIKIAEKKSDILNKLKVFKEEYYLSTVHRPSNTDNRTNLSSILRAFSKLDKKVIFPIHPRTKKFIREFKLKYNKEKIKIIDPLGYLDILKLTKNAKKVITDSGGLQKEAFYLKREVVVLREESEWTELVDHKVSWLAGSNEDSIVKYVLKESKMRSHFYPYGKGDTTKKIIKLLKEKIL